MRDFWLTSGYALLERNSAGRLRAGDAFLRAFFRRPELEPVAESCDAERALHQALLDDPRRPVGEGELAALADPDARENYRVVLEFRRRLLEAGSLEACYKGLFAAERLPVPPIFMDQLVHAILRDILGDCDWPLQGRAAELFFRSQRITVQDGQVLSADDETVEHFASSGGLGSLGRMLVQSETPPREVELDVLDEANAAQYWQRSDRFDTVLDLTFGRPGLDALCRVMERWIAHFLDLETRIHPLQSIQDEQWRWHSGLDRDSSAILNDLYRGRDVEADRLARLLSLFRLEIKDRDAVLPDMAGRSIYLGLAMDEGSTLRMKPQNLLFNLPLRATN